MLRRPRDPGVARAYRMCLGLAAATLVASGCGAKSSAEQDTPAPIAAPSAAATTPQSNPVAAKPTPRVQQESCEWDKAALSTSPPGSPGGQDGALKDVIVGSWQHTHLDSGNGYEPIDGGKDIRYVFTSSTRMLYCQHVPGATDHASNAAAISWDGNRIVPPGGAAGFTVSSWSDDSMVWINHLDNSKYLLLRR